MADREKVITGLECCSVKQSCSECPWKGLDCNDRLHLAVLELLKEQQPQWISVKDRLPDKQPCEYLVVNGNNVETAICLDNRWITPRRVIKITHWMPLPEPPEEVTQDG